MYSVIPIPHTCPSEIVLLIIRGLSLIVSTDRQIYKCHAATFRSITSETHAFRLFPLVSAAIAALACNSGFKRSLNWPE
jgi:hypothetical protein